MNNNNLCFIHCDQLNQQIATLKHCNKATDTVLLIENKRLFQEPKLHKKRITFAMTCMREFAQELRLEGYKVDYIAIGDHNRSLTEELQNYITKHQFTKLTVTEASEYQIQQDIYNIDILPVNLT